LDISKNLKEAAIFMKEPIILIVNISHTKKKSTILRIVAKGWTSLLRALHPTLDHKRDYELVVILQTLPNPHLLHPKV
jgi:hypothetical protein